MMRVICACSLAAGTVMVSVLGHKWSQLIGPRCPRLAGSDPNSGATLRQTRSGGRLRRVPVGAGRSPRPGRRARQAGCRLPCLRPGCRAHARAAEACALPFTGGRDRSRPECRLRSAGYPPTCRLHHNDREVRGERAEPPTRAPSRLCWLSMSHPELTLRRASATWDPGSRRLAQGHGRRSVRQPG